MVTRAWQRTRELVVHRILRLDDTPHRIAFGVFLGFLVGWTPTMGAQIFLYLIIATILRANRVSGILPIMLTNPITALPIYLFNWRIGKWLLNPFGATDELGAQHAARLERFFDEFQFVRMFELQHWADLGPALKALGAELLVGCLFAGVVCGAIGYVATYYGVKAHRRHRHEAEERRRPATDQFVDAANSPANKPVASQCGTGG